MISSESKAVNSTTSDNDFTLANYRELLELAKAQWQFARYHSIPWGKRFILWRHDIDYSLNRSLALAKLENDVNVNATYFVNPHSEFYNMAEAGQHRLVKEILALGHDIGLHFDAAFFCATSEDELEDWVAKEADHLEWLFGVKPTAFSFHNPVAENLACEADYYGGLINCYSRRFKEEVAYCSDSNGYWRFRRLHDVLNEARDSRLQVLTHPGWWQAKPMPPRQRIFRSIYGRAAATMRTYDAGLEQHGRQNHAGKVEALQFFRQSPYPETFELFDYLWNQGHYQALFLELWRLHTVQVNRICKAHLCMEWKIPIAEVEAFLNERSIPVDHKKLFDVLFDHQWIAAVNVSQDEYLRWTESAGSLFAYGHLDVNNEELEKGCVFLSRLIQNLSAWGLKQSINYDGLSSPDSIGLSDGQSDKKKLVQNVKSTTLNIPQHALDDWNTLKNEGAVLDS